MKKQTTVKTIEQNDNVSLYSICFNGDELSEYEKFLTLFKDNARLNKDFQTIILAMSKIVERMVEKRRHEHIKKMNC